MEIVMSNKKEPKVGETYVKATQEKVSVVLVVSDDIHYTVVNLTINKVMESFERLEQVGDWLSERGYKPKEGITISVPK